MNLVDYEHEQPGTIIRVLMGLPGIFLGIVAAQAIAAGNHEAAISICIPGTILAIMLALFHSLTVRVTGDDITLAFGIGVIRKSFLIDDVESAAQVRTRWINGWGIKKIKGGWLYNVSGYDAVEIRMKNGRIYQIGTDQPNELQTAIESAKSPFAPRG